jgi:hypothetical protein
MSQNQEPQIELFEGSKSIDKLRKHIEDIRSIRDEQIDTDPDNSETRLKGNTKEGTKFRKVSHGIASLSSGLIRKDYVDSMTALDELDLSFVALMEIWTEQGNTELLNSESATKFGKRLSKLRGKIEKWKKENKKRK